MYNDAAIELCEASSNDSMKRMKLPAKKIKHLDVPTVVNPLPEEGRYIRLLEKKWFPRGRKGQEYYIEYSDVTGNSRVYFVVGYTIGIEQPFNPRNQVILRYKTPYGVKETSLSARQIASGHYLTTYTSEENY